jgi:hypothetical protein
VVDDGVRMAGLPCGVNWRKRMTHNDPQMTTGEGVYSPERE